MCFQHSLRILILAFLVVGTGAHAASYSTSRAGFQVTVEPIIGYELTAVNTPTPHTRGMLIYGGRFTVGSKRISGEGEYTRGNTLETFVAQDQQVKTNKENVRLGLRSYIPIIQWLDFMLRAGGQATKLKMETTTISSGTTVTSSPDWEIHPYAGAGLHLNVTNAISAGFDATYLFRSVKDWSQNDVQTSFSFRINIVSK